MSSDRTLRFRQPATRWEDALPTGNGTVGALVYGNIASELVVLNHESLWYPVPTVDSPQIAAEMAQSRALAREGKFNEAQQLLLDAVAAQGYPHQMPIARDGNPYHPHVANISPSHPAFDIAIEQTQAGPFTFYRRSLDPITGEVTVVWNVGEKSWSRRLFVSDADDVVVLELMPGVSSSQAGAWSPVSASVRLERHHIPSRTWARLEDDQKENEPPISFNFTTDGTLMKVAAVYDRGGEFGGVAKVLATGGAVADTDAGVSCDGCESILVLVKLFALSEAADAHSRLVAEIDALPGAYDELLDRHIARRVPVVGRVNLELRPEAAARPGRRSGIPTASPPDAAGADRGPTIDDLLARAYDGDTSPDLHLHMFNYGRHLLYSSARGREPAHHFGLWNGSYYPGFFTQRTHDTNFQAIHWPALTGNMPECLESYFSYIESLLDDWRHNARSVYGSEGVFANQYGTTNGRLNVGAVALLIWTAGAGWLAQPFFDYWQFTGDLDFLRERAVPLLEEIAEFYRSFLTADETGKNLRCASRRPQMGMSYRSTPHPGLALQADALETLQQKKADAPQCGASAPVSSIERSRASAWLLSYLKNS